MKKILGSLLIVVSFHGSGYAQTREFLRNKIEEWGECKTVAITEHGGDLAIYGTNGWAKTGTVPKSLMDQIQLHGRNGDVIQDVVVTEKGAWVLLYGGNGLAWSGITVSLETEMKKYNSRSETITSIAFNDDGDWLVVGEKNYTASSTELLNFIKSGAEDYGVVWTAHFNNNSMVIVYESGIRYEGDVPQNLIEKFKVVEFDVYRLKFLPDGSYFMADKKGNYDYYF